MFCWSAEGHDGPHFDRADNQWWTAALVADDTPDPVVS